MNRRTKYIIFPLLILAAGFSVYRLFYHPDASEVLRPADIAVSAYVLTEVYDNGEGHADSLYLDKTIAVSGIVDSMRRNAAGRIVATLQGHSPGKTAVDCIFDSAYASGQLDVSIGDTVSIRGRCAGRSMNVIMVQCIIEK